MIAGRIAPRPLVFALAPAAAILLLGAAARAAGPNKAACVAAYANAQDLRRTGKLIAAQAELITCSQPSCPAAATVDCVQWLREVEQSLPSVVLSARDAGGLEVANLRVLLDGSPLAEAGSGRAIPVDPGAHTFRFESSAGPAVEERLTIREGEKSRAVSAVFGAKATSAPSAAASEPGGPRRTVMWILGGVGLAGLGVFGGVGGSSLADESALRDTCAPHCKESDVGAIRVKHTIADIGLGVGIASLGVATWLFFTQPARTDPLKPGSGVALRLSITGAAATLGGTF